MADSKKSDHWDLLASTLGAEPQKSEPDEHAPQAEEKTPDIVEDTNVPASAIQAPSEPAATRPARSLSSWDALAMELGIEVKSEPPPPAPAPKPIAKQVVEKKPVTPVERSREPGRPAVAEFGKHIEPFKTSETSSVEGSEESDEKKSRHRRRRRHRGRDKDRPISETKKPSLDLDRETQAEDDLTFSEELVETADKAGIEIEADSEEGEAEKSRQKHRRSRRGSRKRKKKGGEIAQEKYPEMTKGRPAEQAEMVPATEHIQDSGIAEEIAEEDREEDGQQSGKANFRAIPTWEMTVGCIITKNMESRPRRQGNGPSRHRPAESHKRRRK